MKESYTHILIQNFYARPNIIISNPKNRKTPSINKQHPNQHPNELENERDIKMQFAEHLAGHTRLLTRNWYGIW